MIEVKRKHKRIVLVSLDSNLNLGHKQLQGNPNKLKWNKINSYEDACFNLGIDPVEELGNEKKLHRIAIIKLETLALAINEGWIPDWSNTSQKWYPCFKFNKLPNHKSEATENDVTLSARFSVYEYTYDYSYVGVGSRVCFVTEEKARYAGQKFLQLYNDYLIQ